MGDQMISISSTEHKRSTEYHIRSDFIPLYKKNDIDSFSLRTL